MKSRKYAYTLSYGDIKQVANDLIEEGYLKKELTSEDLREIANQLGEVIDWYASIQEAIFQVKKPVVNLSVK